jgi:hypothetical protein
MYSPSQRYRFEGAPSGIPYYGQKRLHMQLGLIFGLIASTWAFSGMLSMEPFPSLSARGNSGGRVQSQMEMALRSGNPLDPAFASMHPREVTRQLGPEFRLKELEFASIVGEPVYIARKDVRQVRVIPVRATAPQGSAWTDAIRAAAEHAIAPQSIGKTSLLTEYDAHYLDRKHLKPLPVLRFELADAQRSLLYVDPKEGHVVGAYNAQQWPTRWLYHGLHSLDLPWLYNNRPAWDIVVLLLLLGGTGLCVTSVIITIQLIGRKSTRVR